MATCQITAFRAAAVVKPRLPLAGHVFSLGRNPLRFLGRQREAGPVTKIYLGRHAMYVVNELDLVHQLLTTEADKLTKGRLFDKAQKLWGSGLVTVSGDAHLRRRRLMQPAFSTP